MTSGQFGFTVDQLTRERDQAILRAENAEGDIHGLRVELDDISRRLGEQEAHTENAEAERDRARDTIDQAISVLLKWEVEGGGGIVDPALAILRAERDSR
jgi:chromosome segregation ATPase